MSSHRSQLRTPIRNKPKEKIIGAYIEKAKNTYIDEMMYRAFATPGPYKNIDALILKSKGFKGVSFDSVKSPRYKPIEKLNSPGPGSYDVDKCYEKLKANCKNAKFMKCPTKTFLDDEVKRRQFVPSVGHYKNIEKGIQLVHRPQKSKKR